MCPWATCCKLTCNIISRYASSWKSPWRDICFFLSMLNLFALFLSNSAKKGGGKHFQRKVRNVKWSIQPLSVCHCQLCHQRASPCEEGVWHKEVEVFLVSHLPKEEASCQKSAWAARQERQHSVGVNDAFFITRCSWWPCLVWYVEHDTGSSWDCAWPLDTVYTIIWIH